MSMRTKTARIERRGRRAQARSELAAVAHEVQFLCWLTRAGWRPSRR
jgi:hypothetical protein